MGNSLSRLGMSAQRPRFKAYEQNPDQVKVWLRETWPEVQRGAKRRRVRVYFGDESTIRSDYHRGTTWGVRGDTPVVAKTGRRFSVKWHHVKSQRIGRTVVATKEQLVALARSVLHSLQQNTQMIKRFFYEEHVRYVLN